MLLPIDFRFEGNVAGWKQHKERLVPGFDDEAALFPRVPFGAPGVDWVGQSLDAPFNDSEFADDDLKLHWHMLALDKLVRDYPNIILVFWCTLYRSGVASPKSIYKLGLSSAVKDRKDGLAKKLGLSHAQGEGLENRALTWVDEPATGVYDKLVKRYSSNVLDVRLGMAEAAGYERSLAGWEKLVANDKMKPQFGNDKNGYNHGMFWRDGGGHPNRAGYELIHRELSRMT